MALGSQKRTFRPSYCCILDQYLGNRHAPLLSGGFCLEAAGVPGGHAPPVGSNLQSHPGVLLVQELPVDPETDPVKKKCSCNTPPTFLQSLF